MGQSIYYHNLTKGWFNENYKTNAVENSDKGDVIKFSERGNALLYDLVKEDLNIEHENEFKCIRDSFFKYFKEFHEEDFI